MKKIKTLLLGLCLLTALQSCKKEQIIRKDANTPEAKADLQALEKAITIMRQKSCEDPTSWYYTAAIHWIPDTIKNNSLCQSYQNLSNSKPTWRNCTHSKSHAEELHFLIWHRMYIYHFEKIVRRISNKPDFALPYWNYTSNSTNLPSIFTNSKSSLYEPSRGLQINEGSSITGSTKDLLNINHLFNIKSFQLFSHNIDQAPHGAIHDWIGSGIDTLNRLQYYNTIAQKETQTGLMGWVPTAAFDPIFWLHHSNIDRLWQQWSNSKNGNWITLEELKETNWTYAFPDETGHIINYSIEDVYNIIFKLNYSYDDTPIIQPTNISRTKVTIPIQTQFTINKDTIITNIPKNSILEITTLIPNKGTQAILKSTNSTIGFLTYFGDDHCQKGCCSPTKTFKFNITEQEDTLILKTLKGKPNIIITNIKHHI